jgi:hypothetical protein
MIRKDLDYVSNFTFFWLRQLKYTLRVARFVKALTQIAYFTKPDFRVRGKHANLIS